MSFISLKSKCWQGCVPSEDFREGASSKWHSRWSLAIDQSWHLYHLRLILLQLTETLTQEKVWGHVIRFQDGSGFRLWLLPLSSAFFDVSCILKFHMGAPATPGPHHNDTKSFRRESLQNSLRGVSHLALLDPIWLTSLSLN